MGFKITSKNNQYVKGVQIMVEKKTILNQNNEELCVEVYLPDKVKGSVVFSHGITGCRKGRTMDDDYFQTLARKFMELNYKVVMFDYSGHGESGGKDYEVSLSKSTEEFSRVFFQEIKDTTNVNFVAFSYGATVLGNFLLQNPSIDPKKIVLYSPCFYPLESCFLSEKSIFGKDIVNAQNNGDMDKNGYAVVGAKNFKFGAKMIDECREFSADMFKGINDRIMVLAGKQDVILETKYNEEFCKENSIELKYFDASHSLFEDINNVFEVTIKFINE